MSSNYQFSANNAFVVRSSDGTFIPWDAVNNQPIDISSFVGRTWIADGSPPPEPYVAPPPPVPETISRHQFAMQLAVEGDISWDDAIAFGVGTALPAIMANAVAEISTTTDPNAQNKVKLTLLTVGSFDRHNPMTEMLGQLIGKSPADLDALWTAAAAIV